MESGDRIIAFDEVNWKAEGRPEDKNRFWRPATILYINPHYPDQATITWDHGGPRNTSHGHLLGDLKEVPNAS